MKGLVPVSSFVETNIQPATKSISRKGGKRVHSISANTVEGAIASVQIKKVKDWLETEDLGRGVTVGFDGFDKYNKEAADFLVLGFITMLFVMLIVLVAQFNSFYQANIVLSAILLSFGGVFISLLILDRSFSTLQTGISCVISALMNIGPGFGDVGPTENFAQISAPGKWFLAWLMLIGRLEMFTALVLLFPSFWKK